MVKMMIIVVLVYGMCWLPIHIVTLVGDYDPRLYEQEYTKLIWNTSFWLAMSHACYNPFVYVWMNKTFRRGFYKIFATCCCKKARRTNSLQEEHTMTMTLSTRNGHSGSHSGSNSVWIIVNIWYSKFHLVLLDSDMSISSYHILWFKCTSKLHTPKKWLYKLIQTRCDQCL